MFDWENTQRSTGNPDPMNMKLSCKEIQQVVRDAVIEKLMLDPILFRFRYGNRLPFYGHRYLGEHFDSADHVI